MSFNKNISQYLINGIQFDDPKLKDALSKIIEGLSDLYEDFLNIDAVLTNSGIGSTSIIPTTLSGNWIPIDASGAALTFTYSLTSRWVKIGSFVSVIADLQYPVTASGANASITGLPFICALVQADFQVGYTDLTASIFGILNISTKNIAFFNVATGGPLTNANLSGKTIRFSSFYYTNE